MEVIDSSYYNNSCTKETETGEQEEEIDQKYLLTSKIAENQISYLTVDTIEEEDELQISLRSNFEEELE